MSPIERGKTINLCKLCDKPCDDNMRPKCRVEFQNFLQDVFKPLLHDLGKENPVEVAQVLLMDKIEKDFKDTLRSDQL